MSSTQPEALSDALEYSPRTEACSSIQNIDASSSIHASKSEKWGVIFSEDLQRPFFVNTDSGIGQFAVPADLTVLNSSDPSFSSSVVVSASSSEPILESSQEEVLPLVQCSSGNGNDLFKPAKTRQTRTRTRSVKYIESQTSELSSPHFQQYSININSSEASSHHPATDSQDSLKELGCSDDDKVVDGAALESDSDDGFVKFLKVSSCEKAGIANSTTSVSELWSCDVCTFNNKPEIKSCEMCETYGPTTSSNIFQPKKSQLPQKSSFLKRPFVPAKPAKKSNRK